MSGGSRKAHTKSRRGCAQCKRRRVRCDLRPPVCSNCERRGEQCEYLQLQIGYNPNRSDSESTTYESGAAESSKQTERKFSHDALDDELELHFRAVTSKTLGMIPLAPDGDPWQQDVPIRMQSNRFLWHGVLSITALHLSYLRPELAELYYQRACQHQDQALPLFRAEVGKVEKDNVLEVVGFCVIISMFNFFVAKRGSLATPGGAVDVFEPLFAIRSGALLVHDCLPAVGDHGGSLDMAIGRLWQLPPPPIDNDARQALDGLDGINNTLQTAGLHATPCFQALSLLRQSFLRFSVRPKGWLHIVFWPTSVSQEYVDLLKGGDQAAMAMFIYWLAYMNNGPKVWWLEGWAEAAGQMYLERMDPAWEALLTWPRSQLDAVSPPGLFDRDEANFLFGNASLTTAEVEAVLYSTVEPLSTAPEALTYSTAEPLITAPWTASVVSPTVTGP